MGLRCAHLLAMSMAVAALGACGAVSAAGTDGGVDGGGTAARDRAAQLQDRSSLQLFGLDLGNDDTAHAAHVAGFGYPGGHASAYLGGWHWGATEASAALTVLRDSDRAGYGAQDDMLRGRSGASFNSNIVRLAASISRALPRDWQLRAMLKGQYTSDALLPGDQFGMGGASASQAGRGFSERDITDDLGLAGNLELYTPNLCGAAGWSCRALGFYDSAYVKRNHELSGELRSATVGSVGLGLRMLLTRRVNLQLDYGHVLRADATDGVDPNRVHVRMSLAY